MRLNFFIVDFFTLLKSQLTLSAKLSNSFQLLKKALTSVWLMLTLVLVVLGLSSCSLAPSSLQEFKHYTERHLLNNEELPAQFFSTDTHNIHYRVHGSATKAQIIWLHGTPGSWVDVGYIMMDKYLSEHARVISLDRPGWGQTTALQSDSPAVALFSDQVEQLAQFTRYIKAQHPDVPVILAGHSWGGSLVPALALSAPESIDAVLIAAGGISPALTEPRWYNFLARHVPVKWLLSDWMLKANDEVDMLSDELRKFSSRYSSLNKPVYLIQGEDDGLVDPENATYAEQAFISSPQRHVLRLDNQGHLLQAEQPHVLIGCLSALINKQPALCVQ